MISIPVFILGELYIRYVCLMVYEPFVCRLSVTLLHPKGRDLNFSAIFLHGLIAQGLGQFVLKFCAKIRRGSRGSCKL